MGGVSVNPATGEFNFAVSKALGQMTAGSTTRYAARR
jgi:hypothetical protein